METESTQKASSPGIPWSVTGLVRHVSCALNGLRYRKLRVKRLYLEVTHRCNLRCIACYTMAGSEKPDALTLEERRSVVLQAKEMGAQIVSLSGSGEPLLYKDLFGLVDFIRQLGMRVVMFTNGTLIDARTADFLMTREMVVYFQLPALTPQIVDRMTGKKNTHVWVEHSYQCDGARRTVTIPAGLKHLLDVQQARGKQNLVRVEALITRVNHACLPDVARFSRDLGLGLHPETPVLAGRALENYPEISLRGCEYRHLYETLRNILGQDYMVAHRTHQCAVEKNPVVWTNGEVAFCASRGGGQVGNVRNAALRQLFARARKLKRKQDRRVVQRDRKSKFFHTCSSRQYYEVRHGLSCECQTRSGVVPKRLC